MARVISVRFPLSFIILITNVNMVDMIKVKSCYVSMLISLLNVFEENPKNHFLEMGEWRH